MMMGFLTLSITRSWKIILVATLGVDPGHVLILIPLSVFKNVEFFTVIPLTSSSFSYLPRLPTLSFKKKKKNYQTFNLLIGVEKF